MKIGEFFEKHVQWIALGLGGVWLLWVIWAYGINRPQVDLAGQTFSPGSVDEQIRDNEMQALMVKISDNNVPAMDVPDFTDAFASAMNGQSAGELPFVVHSPPPYTELGGPSPTPDRVIQRVAELPRIMIPTEPTVAAGRSQIILPSEKAPILRVLATGNANAANVNAAPATTTANPANAAAGNATAATDAAAGRPNIFDSTQPQPQPAANAVAPAANAVVPANVAPAAAPLPGQPVGTPGDRTWVTLFAKLNFNEQDREFTRVKLPQFLMQKQYIEVQLQRQEVLPDGTFGTIELVKGLPMNQPAIDRSKPVDFIRWSADPEAQRMILAPPFYFVVKGTVWEIPRKDAVAVAQNQAEEFNLQQKYQEYKLLKTDAERFKFVEGWTNEQKAAFAKYRRDQADLEAKSKAPQPTNRQPQRYIPGQRGPNDRGGAGGRPINREGNFDVVDPALLREMYADSEDQIRRSQRRPMPDEYDRYRRGPYGPPYRRPMYEGEYNLNQPFQGGQQILGNLTPDPLGNVDIWAHDETALPGRTYRYRLRAVMRNPLFDTKNIATDPKMQQVPYLPADVAAGTLDPNSGWSDWSKPVAIPTNVNMMLVSAQNLNGREIARFRVQRWQEGQLNESPRHFEVAPGDTIGGPEKVNVAPAAGAAPAPGVANAAKQVTVDFTTAWTLVDIRQSGNDTRVRIMDKEGRMEVRTVVGDRNRFKDDAPKQGNNTAVGTVGLR